jgi:hypothetical protein
MKKILWIIAGSLMLVARVGMAGDDFYGNDVVTARIASNVTAEIAAALAAETNSIHLAALTLVQGKATTNAANIVLLQGLGSTNAGLISAETTYAKPQVDTNATTTATLKTPRYVGDMLIGSAGSGTGAVWVATVATTNGWLAIKP